MERLMSITDFGRQLRPREYKSVNHLEKIQSLLSESTDESTKMELVIVACYNLSGKNIPSRYLSFRQKILKSINMIDGFVLSWS